MHDDDKPFVMSAFQYRLYAVQQAGETGLQGANVLLPPELSCFTRILQTDWQRNEGEGREAAVRCVLEVRDGARCGVVAVTVDALVGEIEFRWSIADNPGAETSGRWLIRDMVLQDFWPYTLVLYRLCELADAQGREDVRGFIAAALSLPDGLGYPKFTASLAQRLLAKRQASLAKSDLGYPPTSEGIWYAHCRRPWTMVLGERPTLGFLIGTAFRHNGVTFMHDDLTIEVSCENGGFGRTVPKRSCLCGRIYVGEGDAFFALTPEEAAELLGFVPERFPRLRLSDYLKTAG